MPLFRSQNDIRYIESLNRELLERIIGEKITYYAISEKHTESNIYGESLEKVFDPPVQIYGLIEWDEQEVKTTDFGQDIIYSLKCYLLDKHLDNINLKPKEGDMIDYNNVQFEITDIQNPNLLWGKTYNSFNIILNCKSVRQNTFRASISASVDLHARTRPDNYTSSSFAYTDILFPYTGTVENL